MQGDMVLRKNLSANGDLDISEFPKGIYLLQLTEVSTGVSAGKKLVVE